jgi:hypothetical protein
LSREEEDGGALGRRRLARRALEVDAHLQEIGRRYSGAVWRRQRWRPEPGREDSGARSAGEEGGGARASGGGARRRREKRRRGEEEDEQGGWGSPRVGFGLARWAGWWATGWA